MTSLAVSNPAAPFDLAALPANARVEGLYVHVPFCGHKCHYCDFYSITRQSEDRMRRFVELLLREAALWKRSQVGGVARPQTVFFGGGTPTLLPAPLMLQLIEGLRQRLDLSRIDEWTVEANPATVDVAYCQMLRHAGVDRLSLGAQSFDRSELAVLERHHHPDDIRRGIEAARSAGFGRLNVDLIYAIPGQDLPSWSNSLDSAISLKTPHISCYNLTYEPNTPMAVRKRLGHFQPVSEELELAMLAHTRRRLTEAGYRAYEVSNYAVEGQSCRHNLVYWTGGNYIGLGPSAASHVEGHRWKNRPHLGEWERAVESDALPASEVEVLSRLQRAGELAMLMLRLDQGIRFDTFTRRTGLEARVLFEAVIERLAHVGLINVDTRSITLAERGIPVADAIAGEFLSASDDT